MTVVSTAVQQLRALAPQAQPRIAIVLGSGWGSLTEHVRDALRVRYAELPGFPQATVLGHSGELEEAYGDWAGTENYEMRVDGVERVDPVVLEALRRMS